MANVSPTTVVQWGQKGVSSDSNWLSRLSVANRIRNATAFVNIAFKYGTPCNTYSVSMSQCHWEYSDWDWQQFSSRGRRKSAKKVPIKESFVDPCLQDVLIPCSNISIEWSTADRFITAKLNLLPKNPIYFQWLVGDIKIIPFVIHLVWKNLTSSSKKLTRKKKIKKLKNL